MSFSSQDSYSDCFDSISLPFSYCTPPLATPIRTPYDSQTSSNTGSSASLDGSSPMVLDLSSVHDSSPDDFSSSYPSSPGARWMASQPTYIQQIRAETEERPDRPLSVECAHFPITSATYWDRPDRPTKRQRLRKSEPSGAAFHKEDSSDFETLLARTDKQIDRVKRKASFSPDNASPLQHRSSLNLVDATNIRRMVKGKGREIDGKGAGEPMDVDVSPSVASTSRRNNPLMPPPPPPAPSDCMDVDSPLAHRRTTKRQRPMNMPPPKLTVSTTSPRVAPTQVVRQKSIPTPAELPPPSRVKVPSSATPAPGPGPAPPPRPSSSGPKLHPLLQQQEEAKRRRRAEIEKATAELASNSSSSSSQSRQTPSYPPSAAVPVAKSKPPAVTPIATRKGPPALGMRRTHSLPGNNVNNGASRSSTANRPLPTKQQAFKPPLLKPSQVKQEPKLKPVKEEPSTTTTTTRKSAATAPSSSSSKSKNNHRRALSLPAPPHTSSDEPDPDSSFGDVSFGVDPDALDEAMKQYDD